MLSLKCFIFMINLETGAVQPAYDFIKKRSILAGRGLTGDLEEPVRSLLEGLRSQ